VVGKWRGKAVAVNLPKRRPPTLGGLCLFLDISMMTWLEYRKSADFSYICHIVDAMIRQQKFTGAVLGFFNPAIIARGLAAY